MICGVWYEPLFRLMSTFYPLLLLRQKKNVYKITRKIVETVEMQRPLYRLYIDAQVTVNDLKKSIADRNFGTNMISTPDGIVQYYNIKTC